MNPVIALIITNIIWGAAAPLFKFALTNIPPFTLAFIRFFFASLLFFPFVLAKNYSVTKNQLVKILLGAFFSITINITFFFLAMQRTACFNAPVIASSQPIFLFILATLFMKEKPHKRVLKGIIVSFIGVLIIIISPFFVNNATTIIQKASAMEGNLFLVIATIGVLAHTLIYKQVLKYVDWRIVTCISFLAGSVFFIPFMSLEMRSWSFFQLNGAGWTGIIFGVFFSSALAYGLFMYGISKLDAQEVGIFTYIDPVIAVIIAIPLLREYPTPPFFVGTIFVFAGIFLAERRLQWHPLHLIRRKK